MSKRNITYIKPEEPNFLKRIKEQVGYKEGPSVDTKRQPLDFAEDADFEDTEEELPTVVVLKPEHLTREEADEVQKQLEKEEDEKPADLSERIIFKAPSKNKQQSSDDSKSSTSKTSKRSSSEKSDKKSKKQKKALLSFDDEDEEDDC